MGSVRKGNTVPADDKVMVYIDGSNLYHSLRGVARRTDLDFLAFAKKLVGDRRLQRTYYYNAQTDQSKDSVGYQQQRRFLASLRNVDYLEVRLGRLIYRNYPAEPPYEKGIDVKIATDLLVHGANGNYDVAILVSGDTDFCDALQAVKNAGRIVEVALFDPTTSSGALRDIADRIIRINQDFLADCWRPR